MQGSWLALCSESGAKDESSRFGTLTFNMTHASERGAAARKSQRVTRIAGVEKFVGSRFTPTCNTSRRAFWAPGVFPVSAKRRPLTHPQESLTASNVRQRESPRLFGNQTNRPACALTPALRAAEHSQVSSGP